MKLKLLTAFLLTAGASVAMAQPAPTTPPTTAGAGTCASPFSPDQSLTNYSGSTCGGDIGINLGGSVLGHPSVVFSFVFQDDDTDDGVNGDDLITLTGTDKVIALATSCTVGASAIGQTGTPINLDTAGLTDGTTYLAIVSTNPSLPVTDPPTCGDFTMDNDTLPVDLQKASVE